MDKQLHRSLGETVLGLAAYGFFTSAEANAGLFLHRFFALSSYFTRTSIQLLLAGVYAVLCPSKLLVLTIPAILHSVWTNPHLDSAHTTNLLNTSLQTQQWNLLERGESITGYVSVLENLDLQYRVLRCDHSLLGGEWLVTDERRKEGITVSEPIYAVFEMLEAVRLIQVPGDNRVDSEKSALVVYVYRLLTPNQPISFTTSIKNILPTCTPIPNHPPSGLGIGTAPKALIAHKIATTIIELDPLVHAFATKYFALPSNHTAILQDAVAWVSAASTSKPSPPKYDYILHDVFTGGAEPLPLFTHEFLSDLRTLLTPNGVIALNYAGDLSTLATKQVLNTIGTVFGHQCRMYRDTAPSSTSDSEENSDFLNMVIFCTNAATAASPLEFREPVEADFLGSTSRRHYLVPQPALEMQFPSAEELEGEKVKMLMKGNIKSFEKGQVESARRHWKIMRKVVPAFVWENW